MTAILTQEKVLTDYPPQKEYNRIYRNVLHDPSDWSELEAYIDYLVNYCDAVSIEDKPEKDAYSFNLKSFFGIYRFASGRQLKINLDSTKISDEEKNKMLKEVIEWLTILGPNLLVSLEMLDPCGMGEFELSFSILLNELTSNLMKEYLPLALQTREYTSANIIGRLEISKTVRNFNKGETLFTSERARVNLESLPVLFLIRIHYEMLSALDKAIGRIEALARPKQSEASSQQKVNFALLREIRKNRAYHVDFLNNPVYSHLLEKSLGTDFDDPSILEKVRKEASTRKSLNDIIYLWDALRGKKAPKPQIEDLLVGGYTFKPASKLYELWTLKAMLDVISGIYSKEWSARYKAGKAVFSLKHQQTRLTLTYNFAKGAYHKFRPKFLLRPDFVLVSKNGESQSEQVMLIGDAKYKSRPEKQDLERMLAYLLSYGWSKPEEISNGLFLYIGTNTVPNGSVKGPYERKNPTARVYSICLRPNPNSYKVAKNRLEEILKKFCFSSAR